MTTIDGEINSGATGDDCEIRVRVSEAMRKKAIRKRTQFMVC